MVALLWVGIEGWGTKREVSRSVSGSWAAVQSWAGRPAVRIWLVARPAWRVRSARSSWPAGVAVEEVAELGAGEAVGVCGERGVDLFGERVAGGALERPGGGAGGVVPERERGVEVRGLIWRAPSTRA